MSRPMTPKLEAGVCNHECLESRGTGWRVCAAEAAGFHRMGRKSTPERSPNCNSPTGRVNPTTEREIFALSNAPRWILSDPDRGQPSSGKKMPISRAADSRSRNRGSDFR